MSYPKHLGVVVAVDGSAPSRAAVEWAAQDAALRNVPLTAVHVACSLAGNGPVIPPPAGFGEWQERQGRQFLNQAVEIAEHAIPANRPLEVNTEMYYSAVVPTLVDMSKDAELMVVGRRGQAALGSMLGSVSSGLVHHARCPVAVIHEHSPAAPNAPVVVGIDGSPISEFATAVAFDQASRRNVDLVAVHAWSDAGVLDFPGLDWSTMKSSEEAVLAERLAGWRERFPDTNVHPLVVCDHPARQLIEQASTAQLAVVGSHGRGGFTGMLLGSVSAAVVQSTQTPVIVARQAY